MKTNRPKFQIVASKEMKNTKTKVVKSSFNHAANHWHLSKVDKSRSNRLFDNHVKSGLFSNENHLNLKTVLFLAGNAACSEPKRSKLGCMFFEIQNQTIGKECEGSLLNKETLWKR